MWISLPALVVAAAVGLPIAASVGDTSNQYTALGAVKPGLFRRWLVSVLLVLIDYACRHVFTHGFLARVEFSELAAPAHPGRPAAKHGRKLRLALS